MKKQVSLFVALVLVTTGTFAGSSKIELVAPQISAWTVGGSDASAGISSANGQITPLFSQLQNTLNTDYFSKLHDLDQLGKGFANANSAAFDNASLLSFQTYDLFALMGGFNLGLALPSTDPNKIASSFGDILDKGDVYLGLGTGGAAAQLGVNIGLFVPNLYLSGKFGFIPKTSFTSSTADVSFQQGMFGLGANYTLFPQIDLLFGFIKWRGLSVGSGLVYNGNSTDVTLKIADYSKPSGSFDPDGGGFIPSQSLTADLTNIRAKLTVENSSVVIPIEIMTSLQALWFLNVGLGAGVDLTFASSNIKLAGSADMNVSGIDGATFIPGSAKITATDTKGVGDFFVPRLAASVGLNLAIFKLEVPVSYYPLQKAMAVGISGGIVW